VRQGPTNQLGLSSPDQGAETMPLGLLVEINYQWDEVGTPFMEEMRAAAMRLHSRDQAARDGKKEAQAPMEPPIAKWQPTVEGYLRFLVDSKLVFETLEAIVDRAAIPWCQCSAILLLHACFFVVVITSYIIRNSELHIAFKFQIIWYHDAACLLTFC